MVNLTSHVPGEYLQFQVTKRLISNFSSGLDFGEKTIEKSGSGKVSETQGLSRFPRFSPRNRKNTDRRLFLPERMALSGYFELLSSSKLPLGCILCTFE